MKIGTMNFETKYKLEQTKMAHATLFLYPIRINPTLFMDLCRLDRGLQSGNSFNLFAHRNGQPCHSAQLPSSDWLSHPRQIEIVVYRFVSVSGYQKTPVSR